MELTDQERQLLKSFIFKLVPDKEGNVVVTSAKDGHTLLSSNRETLEATQTCLLNPEIKPGRKVLRLYEQVAQLQITQLTSAILPEYDKRIREQPDQRGRLEGYVEAARQRLQVVTTLFNKVNRYLNKA